MLHASRLRLLNLLHYLNRLKISEGKREFGPLRAKLLGGLGAQQSQAAYKCFCIYFHDEIGITGFLSLPQVIGHFILNNSRSVDYNK